MSETSADIVNEKPVPVTRRWFQRFLDPFDQFAATGSLGSVLLITAMLIAMLWANSPWSAGYFALWHAKIVVGPAGAPLSLSLQHWINDGLMAVFFLLVGLEIKRELLVGELASLRQASLPVVAALGGMIVPALLYVSVNGGSDAIHGWGIPMATDIAFALGVLQLLGPRVPIGLKIFLTALAIIDDMGAIVVIALFYTENLAISGLLLAVATLIVLIALNKLRVRQLLPYMVLGIVLWYAFLSSGIHATITGVLLALTIPVRTRINSKEFSQVARELIAEFEATESGDLQVLTSPGQQEAIHGLDSASTAVQSPLLRVEHALASVVAFVILPLFALANAGVALGGARLPWVSSVGLGVLLGLMLGKPIGITLFSWLAVKLNWSSLPQGVSWRMLHGAAWLGGIGFTMALFIAGLAFDGTPRLDEAKLSILVASAGAAIIGRQIVRGALRGGKNDPQPDAKASVGPEPLS